MSDEPELPAMPTVPAADPGLPGSIELGAFSVSLNVADLDEAIGFYTKLGFVEVGRQMSHGIEVSLQHRRLSPPLHTP